MAGPQTEAPGGHGHEHGPGPPHGHAEHEGHEGHAHDEHGFLRTVQAIGIEQRRQRRRIVALATLFALAGATVLAEWFARRAPAMPSATPADCGGPPGLLEPVHDPVLRYARVPDFEAGSLELRSLCAWGVATPDRPIAAEAPRVLLLGDADVLALSLESQDRPAEGLAARIGSGWAGLALGAPGWTAGQAVQAFARAQASLAPELVVLDLTDAMVDTQGAFVDRHGRAFRDFLPLPDRLKRFLWRHSALYARLAKSYTNEVLDVPDPATDARPPNAFARPENQDAALAAVARLAELCRASETPLLVCFRTAQSCEANGVGAQRMRAFGARLAELDLASATTCGLLPDPEFLFEALERAGLVP